MRYKYNGPKFEDLPEEIRGRIDRVAHITERETSALGVVVTEETNLCHLKADELWEKSGFQDFKEVYVYDNGMLNRAYFKVGDKIYALSFCGTSSSKEKEKIERGLGLDVTRRSMDNVGLTEILIQGQPLEKIVELGHQPNINIFTIFTFETSPSGPYMGRK